MLFPFTAYSNPIHPSVHRQLKQSKHGVVNILVTFPQDATLIQDQFGDMNNDRYLSRKERTKLYVEKLRDQAAITQADLLKELSERLLQPASSTRPIMKYQLFWITNEVLIENADNDMLLFLEKQPNVEIQTDRTISLDDPMPEENNFITTLPLIDIANAANHSKSAFPALIPSPMKYNAEILADPIGFSRDIRKNLERGNLPWGLYVMDVHKVHDTKNLKGEGIVFGSIDTGVRGDHIELVNTHRRYHGWLDPIEGSAEPVDENGHGTHTTASAVGKHTGVAPEAEWIACRACLGQECKISALLQCAEFMICPTDNRGLNPDCSAGVDVVNNSWGGGKNQRFEQIHATWKAAGIVAIFSNGNSGSECNSGVFPGNYADAISIGSTTFEREISTFSSRGDPRALVTKPDFSAPGQKIISASSDARDSYKSLSGTSMAAPHVAGVACLLLQINPDFEVDDIRDIFIQASEQEDLKNPSGGCEAKTEGGELMFPNIHYGHGQLNALMAVEVALKTPGHDRSDNSAHRDAHPNLMVLQCLAMVLFGYHLVIDH